MPKSLIPVVVLQAFLVQACQKNSDKPPAPIEKKVVEKQEIDLKTIVNNLGVSDEVIEKYLSPSENIAVLVVGKDDQPDKIYFVKRDTEKYRVLYIDDATPRVDHFFSPDGSYIVYLETFKGPFRFLEEDKLIQWIDGNDCEWDSLGLDYNPAVTHEFIRWSDSSSFEFDWGCCGEVTHARFDCITKKHINLETQIGQMYKKNASANKRLHGTQHRGFPAARRP